MTCPSIASLNNYGNGILVDELAEVNPQSEVNASALNNLRNDTAAVTATAPKLLFQFDGYNGSTAPVVVSSATWTAGWDSMWSNTNNAYKPLITYVSTGNLSVQLPASVPDFIGGTNLINMRFAKCQVCSGTTPASFICTVTSSSTFTIQIFTLAGSPTNLSGALITCEVF